MKLGLDGIYKKLCNTTDHELALKNENQFFAALITITLLTAALTSTLVGLFILKAELYRTITDSIHLLSFTLAFWLSSKLIKNENMKMYVFSALLFGVLIFSVSRYYYLIGPAVWMGVLILGAILLLYSKSTMIILFAVSSAITNIYMWRKMQNFDKWGNYYISQAIIFFMLFFVFFFIMKIAKARQETIHKQYEDIYISEEKMYSTLLSVGDGVITIGTDNRVQLINPVTEKLTGWTQAEAAGKTLDEVFKIVHEYTKEPIKSPSKTVFETGEIVQLENHTVLISKDGTECAIEDTAAPIKDKSGNIMGCVLVFRDFSEKKEKQKRIEYLSYHDQLTGLYNRRFLEEEISRIDVKRNYPLSFVYADVNGLKIINDAFGHEVGDQLIIMVAESIKAACRADEIIARVGGDEFVMLLPKTDVDSGRAIVKRINGIIKDQTMMDIQLSVSFGGATKWEEGRLALDVLNEAEERMYQRKIFNSGSKRNGIIKAILQALLVKCPREEAHSKRVSELCEKIGDAYLMSPDSIKELATAGELHDIGKIAVDESILNKAEKLSVSEWAQITSHAEIGYRLLGATSEFYKISEYVLAHHEKWDGTGYPNGISGENINWSARVIAIADSYDAMVSERPYKKALSKEQAIAEIKKNAGTQFDPDIAKTFVEKVLKSEW